MQRYPDITVLYVDDEKDNLFVFKANFNRKFEVLTSTSPILALEQLDVRHDDIIAVISDMKMPVMNGVEFIRKAKAKYEHIFYFLLTGFGHNEEIEEAQESKLIMNCFKKPFDVDEIEEAIVNAANHIRSQGNH